MEHNSILQNHLSHMTIVLAKPLELKNAYSIIWIKRTIKLTGHLNFKTQKS